MPASCYCMPCFIGAVCLQQQRAMGMPCVHWVDDQGVSTRACTSAGWDVHTEVAGVACSRVSLRLCMAQERYKSDPAHWSLQVLRCRTWPLMSAPAHRRRHPLRSQQLSRVSVSMVHTDVRCRTFHCCALQRANGRAGRMHLPCMHTL